MLNDVIAQLRERGLMDPIEEQIGQMMALSQRAFRASGAAFLDQRPVDFDLYAQDKWINNGVGRIRKLILEYLSRTGADDVTGDLVFITVINDIESIGDLGKSILTLARQVGGKLPESRYLEELRSLHQAIDALFPDATKTLLEGNEELGHQLIERLDRLHQTCQGLTSELLMDANLDPRESAALALCTRYFRRLVRGLHKVCSPAVNPFVRVGSNGRDLQAPLGPENGTSARS
jgi:hypothetical protein